MFRIFAIFIVASALTAQTQTGGLTPKGVVDASGAISTAPSKSGTSLPATCAVGQTYIKTDASAAAVLYVCTALNTWTQQGTGSGITTHSFICSIGSATGTSVIGTGDTGCYGDGGSFTGTITRADIIGNGASLATCSVTVDVWLASGAYPTSSDKISASAPLTLSAAKTNYNMTRTGWTNTVPSNPTFGASVASVTGCVYVQVRLEFQ